MSRLLRNALLSLLGKAVLDMSIESIKTSLTLVGKVQAMTLGMAAH